MELSNLIPKSPPKNLIAEMKRKENWWDTGALIYKCISRKETESWLDCEDLAADCRKDFTAKPALLWCSECERYILADYIPVPKCSHGYGNGGVTIGAGPGNQREVEGDFQRNTDLRCPSCGAPVKLYHTGDCRTGIVEQHGVVVPTVQKKRLILEEWCITRDIGGDRQVRWSTAPVSAYILDEKKWHKFVHARRAPFNCGLYQLTEWEELKKMRDNLNVPYLYLAEFPSLDGTVLENAKLWEYARQTYQKNCCFPIAYIRLYLKHPQVENLITYGMGEFLGRALAEECVNQGSIYNGPYVMSPQLSWIDWKAAKPTKMLRLTKEQLRTVLQDKWGPQQLRFWLEQTEYTFAEIAEAFTMESFFTVKRICEEKIPLKKTLNYLKKQNAQWYTLEDYWRMARNAELDLTQDVVRWPPQLRGAHDRLVDTTRYEHSKKERAAFAKMTERCRGLVWEHEGICIRPAESPEELVQEGRVLHHCVGGYSSQHTSGKIILFIRHTRRPERSWFTLNVDVRTKRIIQNHGYGNERSPRGKKLHIPLKVQQFVTLWQKEILEPWELPKESKKEKKESNAPAA